MNSEIIAYRDKTIDIMKDPWQLNHYVKSDESRANDYAGREILELLQNAIDVGDRVKIELDSDTLIVSNSGMPFKTDNIKALMISDNSTKANSADTIGCKGVGFRAALNISDNISIYSNKIHLRFSQENARRLQHLHGLVQTPPMMMCPEETEDATFDNSYTTNIVIKLRDEEQTERIRSQIEDLDQETILFFNDSFKTLETVIDGEKNTFSRMRKLVNNNEAMVTIKHNDETTILREFFEEGVLDDFEDELERKYRLSIIYSPERIYRNKLFSYFQTDIDFPMDYWYAHGTFNLTNNRNQLIKNTRNCILLDLLIKLICDSATKISNQIDYTAYKILRAHSSFSDSILEDTDLNSILDEAIEDAPILPTIKDRYISLNSNPVFYRLNLQKYLINMPDNERLLKHTNDEEVLAYLSEDRPCKFNFERVSNYLDEIKDGMDSQDRMVCAKLLYIFYSAKHDDFADIAPNFFIDKDGNEIENGSILIESPEAKQTVLPGFMKMRYLDDEQLQLAKHYLSCLDDESFARSEFAKAYGIEIAGINEILDNIDDYIKEKRELIPKYVRWLFDNRASISQAIYGRFYILTKDNEIRRSYKTYFGKEYIKDISLEKFYDSSKIIASPETFYIKPDEVEEFTAFLKQELDVADYPRRVEGSIDGLTNILKYGSKKFILGLLIQERNYLNDNKYRSDAQDCFQSEKWITAKGKRYAPIDIVITSNQNYHKINEHIDDDFLFLSEKELLSGIQMEKSDKVWLIEEYLSIKTELRDLDNKYIYKILNDLSSFDSNGEISEDVYKNIIVNNDEREEPDIDLPEFCSFISSGKVFCLDKVYHDVKDCLYLRKKYPRIIESEHNFINIPKGRSAGAIWDRFHIDELSVDYSLNEYTKSKSNTFDFKTDLNNFKVSLLIENGGEFDDNQEKVKILQEINIILCSRLTIKYDGKIGELDNYEFVSEDNNFYLKVPNKAFAELKKNDKFQDSLSDIFKAKFTFLNKDGIARAIGRDINSRIEKAKEDYGNNSWNEAETKLNLLSAQNRDFSSDNLVKLNGFRDKYFEEYERRLYSKLQNAPIEEKASFVDRLSSYREYEFDINDIPSGKDANMLDYLYGIYPIFNEKLVIIKDINRQRNESLSKLRDDFVDYIDILNQLLDDNRFESLLRFGELSPIRGEMFRLVEEIKKSTDDTLQTARTLTKRQTTSSAQPRPNKTEEELAEANQPDSTARISSTHESSSSNKRPFHIDSRKILKQYGDAIFVDFDDVKPRSQHAGYSNTNRSPRHLSYSAKKTKEERAKKAEKIALEELAKLDYDKILWVSAYAKEEGINPNGADGYGYDIQCEKNGHIRYIEVKSSTSSTGIEFEMTENELNFCSQNADSYDIMYVYAMDNMQQPKVTLINNVFSKITDSNKAPASYRITLK